jgi:hypothetical protein
LGALIFAASLALIGTVLTRWNQRIISNRQIAAKRREEELALHPTKQQIASAFIGEIDVIVNELHDESLRPAIENALHALEARAGKVEMSVSASTLGNCSTTVQLSLDYFPAPFPKGLSGFMLSFEKRTLTLSGVPEPSRPTPIKGYG